MRDTLRTAHAVSAWLLVAGIIVQVFLAGSAILNLGGSGDFSSHREFGYTVVGLLCLAVVLTAVAARSGRRAIGISFGLLVLYIVQTTLPAFRGSMPSIAALHPVNAMLLFGLSAWYARRAWRERVPVTPSAALVGSGAGGAPAAPADAAAVLSGAADAR
jgi:hypothetical protein